MITNKSLLIKQCPVLVEKQGIAFYINTKQYIQAQDDYPQVKGKQSITNF